MLDYAAWTKRASQFIRSLNQLPGEIALDVEIERAANDDFQIRWLTSDSCSIPEELRCFLSTASAPCDFRYAWKPPFEWQTLVHEVSPIDSGWLMGGGDFCEAAKYSNYDHRGSLEDLTDGLASFLDAGLRDEERAYGRVPLMTLSNGDKVSLELEATNGSRRVHFVPANDRAGTRILSERFDDFLAAWEMTSYIELTPENIARWTDPVTGYLRPDKSKSNRFRQLLRDAQEQSRES